LPEGCLPQRVSIFGVSSLPRLYLDLYTALSEHLELHLFILSPTREYWADIATPHEVRRELRRDHDQDEVSLHLDEAPSLLASLGRLGRDFHRMIEEDGSYAETSGDLYREPFDDGSSMLAALQSDILNLRGAQDDATLRRSIDGGDRSVRVHSCHGPMREVEVLCEELMSSFEADPTLEPQDIIVMTPSVRTYAPYIEAVFGTRTNKGTSVRDGEGAIPYRIADRWPQPGDQIVDAFARGLDFVGSRFGVSDALDLLDIDCIRERFEFEPADLPVVRTWIVEAGVRWGVDAEHREANDVPGNRANTWQFGLDRLLLGYALEDDHHSVFQGARPVAGVEGQNAEVLGRVLAFIHFLSAQRETLAAPRSLQAWREALLDFLAGLVVYGAETQEQHQTIRSALDKLMAHGAQANFEGDVSLTSVREQLDRNLELAHAASGFLTGGVTFCELVPMRSIPFRVVCLLGMNDDEFPRIRHALGFDLIAKKRRVGDRTAREDDRYLFLEAILSARQQLIISFVGQSIKDGAELPPSAVVSELL
ncbi:MAG: exodeoxyribonuclease V subunit gamma, partial [Myxococcales bacterium]